MMRRVAQIGMLGLGIALMVLTQAAGAQTSRQTEIDRSTTTTDIAQAQTQSIKITGVKLQPDGNGIEIVSDGKTLNLTTRTQGKVSYTDIPNAVLALPDGKEFRAENPTKEIANISVTQVSPTFVRVLITGTNELPVARIVTNETGLIVTTTPAATTAESNDEIEINVVGLRNRRGYKLPNATTGGKTDALVRDLPFSVQVVPRELLRDRQVENFNEALRTVAGVTPDNPSYSPFEGFTIRGFTGRNIIRNGLRDDTNITTGIAIPNIEQIEVLKGPAGALFSQGSPGGTINIITKKPLTENQFNAEAGVGSFGSYKGSIDWTGPLNDSKTAAYRFIAAADTTQTFIDFFERRNYTIAPSVSWQVSPATKVTVEGEYAARQSPNARGLPAQGTVLPNINGQIPRNRFIGEPNDDLDKNDRYALRVGFNIEHQISKDWQLNNALRLSFTRTPQNSLFPSALGDDQRTLERGLFSTSDQSQENYILDTNIVGNFKTGDIPHQLLVGFDMNKDIYAASNTQFALAPIDLFNPVYGQPRGAELAVFPREPITNQSLGIYLQDRIELSPQVKVLVGGRFDLVNQRTDVAVGTDAFQQDTAFSPRLGLVYQPTDTLSVYGSYSQSFLQSVGTAFDRSLFRPERGTQYEIGVKADWLERRLSSTLSLFDLTRSNVLTGDPLNPNFSIQTGEQKSRGVELETTGEILPGWKVAASYTYTDARISADNTLTVGNRINNVPENALSLFSTYELQSGDMRGLGFGLGLFHVGDRQGDLANSFRAPGYTRTDATIFYKRDDFRVGLNIENLFNIGYFEAVEGPLRVFPGAPLTVRGTVAWSF